MKNSKYDDIINLSHPPLPTNHPPLSTAQRAGQFAPFKTITKFHDSTDDIENNSDHPETEIIFDEAQLEVAEELYIDDFSEEFYPDEFFE